MSSFSPTQTTDLRDAYFVHTDLSQLEHIVRAVKSPVRSHLLGQHTQAPSGLPQQREQSGFVAGIAVMDFIVNDHPRALLHKLQRATKLHRLVQLALI